MFGFALGVAARAHYLLRRVMPTNILLDAIHTRRGLKWGVPAMLLTIPYAYAAGYCSALVEAGGAGWLSALALLFVWNALKFLVAGPANLIWLIRVRAREARVLRRATGAARGRDTQVERFDEPILSSSRG